LVLLNKKLILMSAPKWSNSPNGLLRYSINRLNNTGIYIGPTQGLSSPKNNRQGCLCPKTLTYSRKCCNGDLIAQGIGNVGGSNQIN